MDAETFRLNSNRRICCEAKGTGLPLKVDDLLLNSETKKRTRFKSWREVKRLKYERYKSCCLICECVIYENWNYMGGLCQICSSGRFVVGKKSGSDLCALISHISPSYICIYNAKMWLPWTNHSYSLAQCPQWVSHTATNQCGALITRGAH